MNILAHRSNYHSLHWFVVSVSVIHFILPISKQCDPSSMICTKWTYYAPKNLSSSKSEYLLMIEMAGSGQLSAGDQWSIPQQPKHHGITRFCLKSHQKQSYWKRTFSCGSMPRLPLQFCIPTALLMAHYEFILYKWSQRYEMTPLLATSDRKNEMNDRNGINRSVWWMMIMSIHSMVGSVADYFCNRHMHSSTSSKIKVHTLFTVGLISHTPYILGYYESLRFWNLSFGLYFNLYKCNSCVSQSLALVSNRLCCDVIEISAHYASLVVLIKWCTRWLSL